MRTIMTIALAAVLTQNAGDTRLRADASARQAPDAHVARARTAAGDTYQNLFNFLCTVPTPRGGGSSSAQATADRPRGGGQGRGRAAGPPDRSTWYAEPVKVFDNLYFVGQSEFSAWAVTTSEGIILIDTLFDYSVEEEVAGGLKKLGLDPATIRYAVVTHPHPDHHGGAEVSPVATRAPGSANPYVVGNAAVRRYLEVAKECATARLPRLN